jgi:hypothetical protein
MFIPKSYQNFTLNIVEVPVPSKGGLPHRGAIPLL